VDSFDFKEESKSSGDHKKIVELLWTTRLIEKLIELLDKFQFMVKNCFASSPVFERARHFSFENFLNKNRDTNKANMAEVMAVYTDAILRRSGLRIEE
jgi:Cullin family